MQGHQAGGEGSNNAGHLNVILGSLNSSRDGAPTAMEIYDSLWKLCTHSIATTKEALENSL